MFLHRLWKKISTKAVWVTLMSGSMNARMPVLKATNISSCIRWARIRFSWVRSLRTRSSLCSSKNSSLRCGLPRMSRTSIWKRFADQYCEGIH
jgi:hypothetical protein